MMRKLLAAGSLVSLLWLCGCMGGTSIVRVEPVPAGTEYNGRKVLGIIHAENRGMYFFNCIPLWSGKPHEPNHRQFTMFRHFLRPGYMDNMLMDEGRRLKAEKVVVASSSEYTSGWFSLWILWSRQMAAEGIALGKETAPAK